jgi:NAD(P)-dependent dehydrogenase (short-subunit alcohol dehydrogenase family)
MRDQHIVVSGTDIGIGRATAVLAAAKTARVTALDRDAQAARQTRAQLQHRDVTALEMRRYRLHRAAGSARPRRTTSRSSYWSGHAAGSDRGGMVHKLSAQTWHEVVKVNLAGKVPRRPCWDAWSSAPPAAL